MRAEVLWSLAPAAVGGLALSWFLETWLRPAPAIAWRRPTAAVGVHTGLWVLVFALVLATLRRPWCAAANALGLQCVFVIVNNAKYRSLREPFVYADFEFFIDAVKHPRLYLPFLGWQVPLATALVYGLALWGALVFEPPLTLDAALWGAVGFGGCAGLLAWMCGRHLPLSVAFNPVQDVQTLGLFATLWQYALAERVDTQAVRAAAPFTPAAQAHAYAPCPDLVVVQSESFFDPRGSYPQLRADLLPHYDQLRAEALQHGALEIDSWGANTVRTEFAFLSGLHPQSLGVHRFHPYRTLARQGVATLASFLRSRGYRCVCVHPYHASFYERDRVLPLLGFDELIDIRAFRHALRDASAAGSYVGDRVLGQTVQDLLAQDSHQPLYVHVITMENHGPLHWESVTPSDASAVLTQALPPRCEDLVAYARHLVNADAMFGGLRAALLQRAKPATLCVFGDHVPIMPQVYRTLGEPDGATNYLVWCTDQRQTAMRAPITQKAHQLAQVCLEAMAGHHGSESPLPR